MLGTLNGALEVRGIHLDPEDIRAEVEGINRVRDGLPVLTDVVVHYTLRIPPEARETVERALERHQSKCPTAQSLAGAIEVRWTADVQETG
jgi:organic hydroperoxide reductase OsmC/OhrA